MNNNWKKKVASNGRRGDRQGNRGGSNSWNNSSSRLHRATCADCGESCQVPFKPNGSKPILCSDCFSRSDKGSAKSRYVSKPRHPRPSNGDNGDIVRQLKALNDKVDQIINALVKLSDDEEDQEDNLRYE